MNVSLPDTMKEWVETQTRTGRYANASDYVRDLIRRDQEKNDKIATMHLASIKGWRAASAHPQRTSYSQWRWL